MLSCVLLLQGPASEGPRADYGKLRQVTPADAASQVQLALWCEKNGLNVERARHLAKAVLADSTDVRKLLVAAALVGVQPQGEEAKRPLGGLGVLLCRLAT
jgi:hypothetical protein